MAEKALKHRKRTILLASVLLEGLLIVVTLVWARKSHHVLFTSFAAKDALLGLLATIPLFLINWIFFGDHAKHIRFLKKCYEFKINYVRPLASELDVKSAFIVSLFAGVGEELFFRGLVQTVAGVFVASVLFSLLHFGTAVKKQVLVALIYIAIGFYFSLLLNWSGSLIVPIVAHVTYDFVALLYMRYFFRTPFEDELNNLVWR